MLPRIRKHARIAFRHLDPESRDECVQAVACNACCAVARLAELDKLDLAYASVLARFGVAQVRDGRMTGGSLNCNDISSRYCQRAKNITVERLDHYDTEDECWEEVLIPDNTCTPAELAATRIDFPAWMKTLKPRDRKVARFLSLGNRTQDAARKFDVSQGRISQLRKELAESWAEFTGEGDNFSTAA
jgi:hypothetical protein